MSMSTTPSRKRPAEEDAETPGFFSRLFTSAKKPRTVERSTASTPLPRIQLSPPSAATTTSRSNGSARRLVPAQTGLLAPVHVVAKQNVTSWKPPPDGAFTIGSFAPTAARRRRVPYKPESQTLVMKRKRNKQQAKAYSELDLSRILERNKQLFFPKPNAEATASFRMPTAQRKFGSNQTGSRVPSGAAPKVSFEEQIQDKHVSFDQAQTPAASNKPRLRRTQTPGMVMHSEGTTPSPTVPQNIGGSRASGSSTATSQLSSPQTRGSGKYSSLYEPRVPQAPKVASEDGPYELDGAIEADIALGKIFPTANVDVTAPTNLPVEPLVDYAPVRFKRMPKAKPEVVQTRFMPDADEDDNSGIENDPKRVKQGEPGEKKKVLAEGWGNFGKNMFQSKDKWKCAVCQIYNEKSKNICVSCDTPRPDADATEVADATTTGAAAPASSSSFSFGVSAPKQGEKSFSFGVSSPPSAAPNEKPKNFSFGVSSSATPAPAGVKFGVDNDEKAAATPPTGEGFGFGVAKNGSGPKTPAAKISFGVPSSEPPAKKTPTEVPVAPKTDVKAPAGGAKFNFGATPALSADAKPFPFGSAAAAPPKDGKPFQFGSGAPAPPKDGKPFKFGAPTPKANDDGDSQNKKRRSTEEESAPAAAPAAPAFKFGAPAADKQAAPKPSVSFGATPAKPSESKPSFVFGAGPPSTPAPPVTPGPTNGFGQSSTMHAGSTPAPPKGGPNIVFGAGGSTPAPAAPANSFGGASSALPFAAASTPAAPAPAASAFGTPGFGATAATTPAAPAFGATPAAVGGPFGGTPAAGGGFGATPAAPGGFGATPAAPAPGGGFGATPAAPAPGGFGATPAAGGFGATPAAPGAGGFGATPAAAPTPGGFGATPAAGGGFGATPAATPAPGGFGATPAAPAPGGFGASTPGGGFGAGAAPAPSSKFNFGSTAPVSAAGPGGFGAAPAAAGSFAGAPAFGQPAAAAPFAPSAPAGGFGSGTPAPPAPGAGFGAGGGFGSGAPAPPASGFGGGSSAFGAGGMSTPNTGGGGFNIGTGGTKSTGRRRIVRAKRPPGSSHR